jgi:hypothetical protein
MFIEVPVSVEMDDGTHEIWNYPVNTLNILYIEPLVKSSLGEPGKCTVVFNKDISLEVLVSATVLAYVINQMRHKVSQMAIEPPKNLHL